MKLRFDEIIQTTNRRDSLLEEFDEEIFNALVEKKFSHQRILFLS
ncbi:MAG: hypothetical protein P4L35_00590 [Ignavibacteriaceae bacterium]|nr:hypothetical protein [Ignavibacteriaceae bacterium]